MHSDFDIAYSLDEFCRSVRISRSTALREIEKGFLKPARAGRKYVISKQEVSNWLGRRGDGAGQRPFVS